VETWQAILARNDDRSDASLCGARAAPVARNGGEEMIDPKLKTAALCLSWNIPTLRTRAHRTPTLTMRFGTRLRRSALTLRA